MDERVWMRHTVHGGVASFAAGVADVWQAWGWEPCEEPPEDLSHLSDPDPTPASAPGLSVSEPARRRQSKEQ